MPKLCLGAQVKCPHYTTGTEFQERAVRDGGVGVVGRVCLTLHYHYHNLNCTEIGSDDVSQFDGPKGLDVESLHCRFGRVS